MSRLAVGLLLLTLLLAGPRAALAQAPTEPGRDEARELVKRGNDLYRLSRFEDALALYEKAYALNRKPSTLFNVAQCHRQLGRIDRALFLYRTYLREAPDAPNREVVEKLIADLEAQRKAATAPVLPKSDAAAPAAVVTRPAPPAPPPARPWYRRWYVWTAVAAAVVGGAVGGAVAATRGAGAPPSRQTVFGDHTFTFGAP